MDNYKLTFLISILILIPLLSACGIGAMDTPSGALASPSAEPRPEESEATSIPREPPVPTDTPVPPTPVAALPPPTLLYFWAQW
jgi:hypothetical protein